MIRADLRVGSESVFLPCQRECCINIKACTSGNDVISSMCAVRYRMTLLQSNILKLRVSRLHEMQILCWYRCRKCFRGDGKLYMACMCLLTPSQCVSGSQVFHILWEKLLLPFWTITVSKGYSMWKKKRQTGDLGFLSKMSVWDVSSLAFCWGTQFIAALKSVFLKDFEGMTTQIPATV